jgi:hypothetical protein
METRDEGLVNVPRKYLHFSSGPGPGCGNKSLALGTHEENFPKRRKEKRFSAVKHALEIIGQQREMIDLMCAIKCKFIAQDQRAWRVRLQPGSPLDRLLRCEKLGDSSRPEEASIDSLEKTCSALCRVTFCVSD